MNEDELREALSDPVVADVFNTLVLDATERGILIEDAAGFRTFAAQIATRIVRELEDCGWL